MDGRNFDRLTRELAGGASRRRVLRSLVGAAGAGLAALAVRTTGAAPTCRLAGRQCDQNANCCSGLCDTTNPNPRKRYKCICPTGTTECNGQCFSPGQFLEDAENCGGCGNHCPTPVANSTPVCCDGSCDYSCNAGYEQCGVSCFPTATLPLVINKPTIQEALTDTGLSLLPGDSFTISVTGTNDIDGPGGALGTVGPNGYPGTAGVCGGGIDCGAAIASIGGGPRFFIGVGPTIVTASSAGNLFIGSHDLAGAYDVTPDNLDNVGTFTFTINCNVTSTGCSGPIG